MNLTITVANDVHSATGYTLREIVVQKTNV